MCIRDRQDRSNGLKVRVRFQAGFRQVADLSETWSQIWSPPKNVGYQALDQFSNKFDLVEFGLNKALYKSTINSKGMIG